MNFEMYKACQGMMIRLEEKWHEAMDESLRLAKAERFYQSFFHYSVAANFQSLYWQLAEELADLDI